MKILKFKERRSTFSFFLCLFLCGITKNHSITKNVNKRAKTITNDHQDGLRISSSMNNAKLSRPTNQTKTNLEAAKKSRGISIVCRALWQSVVQTCRQRHAYQPVQVAPLFQNHNHNHKTNENQHENSKVQRTKFNFKSSFSLWSGLRSKPAAMHIARMPHMSALPSSPPIVSLYSTPLTFSRERFVDLRLAKCTPASIRISQRRLLHNFLCS